MATIDELRIPVGEGTVGGLRLRPPDARAMALLAHGAGAGMRHAFMTAIAEALAARRIATLRYQFPYAEAGRRRTDPPALCHATVRAALAAAGTDLPLYAGGKSFGGRMTSQAAAAAPLPGVRGIFFLGFPLHPAGKPGTERADHLAGVTVPMLFLQGTRDALAELALIRPVVAGLGARAELHELPGADHSLARSIDALADRVAAWALALQ
ncbi:MAG TPA: alpha/beta family hydrolase [Kofleriaceae bacterium]|nr:alpha/beta family hydrolase [Kofleriaceae bacterium]